MGTDSGRATVTDQELTTRFDGIDRKFEMMGTRIEDGFRNIQDTVTALFDKDIKYVNDKMEQHKNWHGEHFQDIKQLYSSYAKLREDMTDKIANVESKSKEYTDAQVQGHENQSKNSNQYWIMVVVGLLAAVPGFLSLIGG